MQLTTKKNTKLTVNLTSLIDVLFILIIFFAVSSTFLEQPGIELKLPEAESSESYTSQKIIIYVDKGENLFLNDQLISTNTMISEIKKLGKLSPDGSLVLKADKKVSHGKIIEVMDLLRKNGMYKIVMSTSYPDK
jgi:biopolymer transport protein ExbD